MAHHKSQDTHQDLWLAAVAIAYSVGAAGVVITLLWVVGAL